MSITRICILRKSGETGANLYCATYLLSIHFRVKSEGRNKTKDDERKETPSPKKRVQFSDQVKNIVLAIVYVPLERQFGPQ
jgi:hypothetical protein